MKIIRAKDYNDMSRKAANLLSAQVIINESSVLGLATGSTVLGITASWSNGTTKAIWILHRSKVSISMNTSIYLRMIRTAITII